MSSLDPAKAGFALRAYRLLLRCYTPSHLDRFGEEMLETFAAANSDPAVTGSDRVRFWAREIGGALAAAARDRWDHLTRKKGTRPGLRSGPRPSRVAAVAHGSRAAVRSLRESPGFTIGATILFGIGAGAATLMFSIVDSVVLRPLDIPDAERIVQVQTVRRDSARGSLLPTSTFRILFSENKAFGQWAAFQPWALILAADNEVRTLNALGVTPEFLSLIGVRVLAGRGFVSADYEPDAPRVVVIGHAFWQERFGGDLAVIGTELPLSNVRQDERPGTIVGVLPADFRLPPMLEDVGLGPASFGVREAPEVLIAVPPDWLAGERGLATGVLARLSDGVALQQAQASMDALAVGVRETVPTWLDFESFDLTPLPRLLRRHYGPALYLFWAASGLLLLIAYANVANLLTARGLMRRREMAVRASLGADRAHLFVQLLAETGLLGVLGALLGALFAHAGARLLVAVFPGDIYRLASAGLDARALGFLGLASFLPVLAFGTFPAWRGSAFDQAALLRSLYLRSAAPRVRMLRGFVIVQMALALAVVTGGSLLVRTYQNLTSELGFDADSVLTFSVSTLPGNYSKYDSEGTTLLGMILDRLAVLPGVAAVGTGWPPLTWDAGTSRWLRVDPRAAGSEDEIETTVWNAGPGFFEALGIDVIAGDPVSRDEWERAAANQATARELGDDAEAVRRVFSESPLPVVVNETLATRYWSDPQRAVGAALWRTFQGSPRQHRIVGVVRDMKTRTLASVAEPQVFVAGVWRGLVVKTDADPLAVAADIRRAVEDLDPVELSIPSFTTMADLVAGDVAEERFRMRVLGLAAALSLGLAAVGLFSVVGYSVSRRTHEIAVRMSVGARAEDVIRLVVAQSLSMILAGVAIGLGGAAALARSMESLLFGVAPLDPVSFAMGSTLLTAVGVVACLLPALRATAVDPISVLRND